MWQNSLLCPTIGFKNKVHFQGFKIYMFFFLFFLCLKKNLFHVLIEPVYQNSETTVTKQFFLNYFISFLCKSQKCLETCVNAVWNCITALFTALEVQFSKNVFFQKHTPPSSEFQNLFWRWHFIDIEEQNHVCEK